MSAEASEALAGLCFLVAIMLVFVLAGVSG